MKLYGIVNSRAFRSLWALEEIGVEYEQVQTDWAGDTKKPEFLAINPNGRIPVLVDGDVTLFESMAINLYLARKYDGGLQPKTLEDEARAIQWSFWGMTELESPLLQIFLNRVLLPEDQRDPKAIEVAESEIQAPLKVLNDAIGGKRNLLGDAFTIADLNVASVLAMALPGGFAFSNFENVKRWFDAAASRPAAARARS